MKRRFSPGLYLMLSWLRPQLRIPGLKWRPPVPARTPLALAAGTVMVLAVGLTVFWCATGSRLYQMPDQEALIDAFFATILVPFVGLLIAWYIASLKHVPARAREYVFLNSLPLAKSGMHRLFIISGVGRFPWVPFGTAFLLSALTVAAPISFVIRLIALTLAVYVLVQTVGIALHLAASLRPADGKSARFPARNSPLVQLGVIMMYATMPVVWILYPEQITGTSFWIVVVGWALGTATILAISKRVFWRWRATNVILRSRDMRGGNPRTNYQVWTRLLSVALGPLHSNALLVRNLIRSTREASMVSRFILALLFVAMSFLIAMNNESIQDAVTVLSGMFYVYAFFFVTKEMGLLEADEEPPALIYSMPVTRTQLYLSVFVPMMVWLTAIAMVQAILVIIAGGGVQLAARFVSMSILISVVFGVIGVSSAVGGYPDRVDALKRFLGWMLVLAVSIVFLYKYRMVVMMAVAALSLLFLLPKRLYRT